LLQDKLLLAFLSEGSFFLVDLGQAPSDELEISLEIRLPAQQIKRITIDPAMMTLVLSTSSGKILLYHLPTALKNE
jgi:hypothetical protein